MGPNSIDVLIARDIALKGVGIYLPHGFEAWKTQPDVELVITLPGQRPFLARGRVRHSNSNFEDGSFFGVEFVDLATKRREQIRRYLDSGIASRIN
jgi:c-di-GMP-binding flagellar brake protein YcgR